MVAKVTQVIDNQIRINAGASAGLRVGDEWLLADGQHVLDRTLEASLTPHTVLAKVTVVAENHAQLATVAGAIQAVRHNWIGWTTEGSR
jgi:predicted metalloprotease with PDZ domain